MGFSYTNLSVSTVRSDVTQDVEVNSSLIDSLPEDERDAVFDFLSGCSSTPVMIGGYARCFLSMGYSRRPYPTCDEKNHTARRRRFPKGKRNDPWGSTIHGNP